MYTDNTSLAQSAKNVSYIISNVLDYDLKSFRQRLYGNKLSLDVAKTKSMLISTKNALEDKTMKYYLGQGSRYQKNLLSKRHALNIWVFKLVAS